MGYEYWPQALEASIRSAAEITGKVKLKGTPKPEVTIDMSGNAYCGKAHDKPVTTRHFVVSPDKGLANVFVYIKEGAKRLLTEQYSWQPYAHKHYESRFTRFYEGFWLPTKFGFDKRRAHFSSEILSKQMSRDEALARIAKPAYDEDTIGQDFEYVATKLDLSVAELETLLHGPNKSYRDYKSAMPLIQLGQQIMRTLGIQRMILR